MKISSTALPLVKDVVAHSRDKIVGDGVEAAGYIEVSEVVFCRVR